MKRIALVLLVLAGCDCTAAWKIHEERCASGVVESCLWLQEHTEPTTGVVVCD